MVFPPKALPYTIYIIIAFLISISPFRACDFPLPETPKGGISSFPNNYKNKHWCKYHVPTRYVSRNFLMMNRRSTCTLQRSRKQPGSR